jgi:hypothetical protein
MKRITPFLFIGFTTGMLFGETINFDQTKPGQLPSGWKADVTGEGSPKWSVELDETAPSKPNVLKQSGQGTYPWCVLEKASIRDGFIETKFKPISGSEDQAAGLIWRFQDANDYYIVRANALENNVVLYKVQNGKRKSLSVNGHLFGYGVDAKVPKNEWSKLRVDFIGNLFTVSLNDKKIFQVEDSTFIEAGAVGLWTKADSVTLFDDFTYQGK